MPRAFKIFWHADKFLSVLFSPATGKNLNWNSSQSDRYLTNRSKMLSRRLMRINHCGEICAQGLYHGQLLGAKEGSLQHAALLESMEEEMNHMFWLQTRLKELGAKPSLLEAFFYCNSFLLGVIFSHNEVLSMSFLKETEEQVEKHLLNHLKFLKSDPASTSILLQMLKEEISHRDKAVSLGGKNLPKALALSMKLMSLIMVKTVGRIG